MAHRRAFGSRALPALLTLVAAPSALAQEPAPGLSLDWTAPPGCPIAAEVRAQVESLLGAPAPGRARRPLAVRGRVETRGEVSVLHLGTSETNGEGERTLEGATCSEVASAAALIVALAIDPDAVAASRSPPPVATFDPPASSSPPPAPPPTSPEPPPRAPPPVRPVPARPESGGAPGGGLELGVLLDTATLPGVSAGPSIALTLAPARGMGLALEGAYVLPRFADAGSGDGDKGADVALGLGALSGCARLALGEAEIGPCGGLEAGALLAEGRGFRTSSSDTVTWLGLRLGAEARVPLAGSFGLRAGAGAVVALLRPGVQFRSSASSFEEIHAPAEVSARFSLALSWLFW